MIYIGQNEIYGIYVGSDEATIYAGSEQIYPMSITGFTARPTSLTFKKGGETKRIRITSEEPWVASTNDSWLTLSANSGASGRTTLDVTAAPNQTGTELSGTVVISTSNLASSATIDVISKTEYEPTGYITAYFEDPSQAINVPTNFNPYQVLTNQGDLGYMRIEVNVDFLDVGYLWATNQNWFSFEAQGTPPNLYQYQNIAFDTFCGQGNWNTNGTTSTDIFVYRVGSSNNTYTMDNNTTNVHASGIYGGTLPNVTNNFFPAGSGRCNLNFYRMKVFDSENGDPVYDFCPALNNNTPCIFEAVNETYHYPSNYNGLTFIPF